MALPRPQAVLVLESRQVKQSQRELIHLLVIDLHPVLLRDVASPFGLSYSQCCGTGGRRYGQKESPAELSSQNAPAARPRSFQAGSAQQPRVTRFAPRLRIRSRPVHSVVLL